MVVKNISKYLKFMGYTVSMAEKRISLANGTLSKAIKDNKTIKTDTLEKFLTEFDNINPEWLLTGEGKMLKSEVKESKDREPATKENNCKELEADLKAAEKIIESQKGEIRSLYKELGKMELLVDQMRHKKTIVEYGKKH